MNVKDLKARQGSVDIVLNIVEKEEPRAFNKFGKEGKVCNVVAKDDLGDKIKITLWNEQIDQVNSGDKIHITDGWVGEWQGELQLSTGRNGKLEIVGKSEVQPEAEAPAEEEKPTVEEESID